MPSIESLTECAEAVSPKALAEDVFARFQNEPDTLVIAVVENGRVLGLVERDALLLHMAESGGRKRLGSRTAADLMDAEAVVVEADVDVGVFGPLLLTGGADALRRGFAVTRQGRYWGVGTGLGLLRAVNNPETRAASELSAAQDKSRFLTMVSHELRTPLNGVLAVAELLRRQPLNNAAHAHVQTIADSAETLLNVLRDAQDLARAEAGELELSPRPTSLRALMDDIQADWAPQALQDNVTLMVSYEGDTELAADMDAGRLRQVFDNLIGNALKFARNGVVEAGLKARAEGGAVRFSAFVRDDGPGVGADVSQVFEPFVQGASSGGAGLGLSISRRIVERMNGTIRAENNQGRGATFTFEAAAPHVRLETEAASNVSDMGGFDLQTTPHVLIVDDNATNRVVAQALCEMFGCTSETAEDGIEALEAVQNGRYDLILMDIKMPRMDGVQATCAIRALDGEAGRTPIIALTANADPEDARTYLASGMAAVVEKPIKPERLRNAMNAALSEEAETSAATTAGGRRSAG